MEKLKLEIENNLVYYFANMVSSTDFINKNIKKFISLDEEKEEKICNILAESQMDWDDIDCDSEGATEEQNKEMDQYLEKVTAEILKTIQS